MEMEAQAKELWAQPRNTWCPQTLKRLTMVLSWNVHSENRLTAFDAKLLQPPELKENSFLLFYVIGSAVMF